MACPSSLVERLRAHPKPDGTVTEQFRIMVEQRHEAADEIARLQAQLQRKIDELGNEIDAHNMTRAEIERLREVIKGNNYAQAVTLRQADAEFKELRGEIARLQTEVARLRYTLAISAPVAIKPEE